MVTYSNIHTRHQWTLSYVEKIEDTKDVIGSRKSKKGVRTHKL